MCRAFLFSNLLLVGKVEITLTETPNLDLKMIPGKTLDKDPTAAVVAGSEDCYLFVKIEESDNLDDFITYVVADGWTALDGVPGVYWREAKANDSFPVIGNKGLDGTEPFVANKVLVNKTVTNEMMTAEDFTQPTLTFTAYAVQKAEVADAATAWTLI